ncbi:MAG: hypothetical protein KJ927_11145 [Candidatus Eisenbacteria bacterium]|nr:hypothetical protein [Candidatus Eisenbacteria bacterium]
MTLFKKPHSLPPPTRNTAGFSGIPSFYMILLLAFVLMALSIPSSATIHSFRLMTYNIYWGGFDHDPVEGRNYEWLGVIKSRNPDILLIEEAVGWTEQEDGVLAAVVDSLNTAFPDQLPYEGRIGTAGSGFHVAVLSRFPINDFEFYNVVDTGEEVIPIYHVFIHATIEIYNETVHLIGVHFKPGDNRLDRETESRALVSILESIPAGETIWIGGDFNSYSPVDTEPGSPTLPWYDWGAQPPEIKGWEPMEALLNLGYEDAFRTLHPLELGYTQGTEGFYGLWPVQRVDFILKSPGGMWNLEAAETVNDSLGHIASDHYALSIDFSRTTSGIEPPDPPVISSNTLQMRPNPMRGEKATVEYNLTSLSRIKLRIIAPSGRCLKTLVDEFQRPGHYSVGWDGTDHSGGNLPSGAYFIDLQQGSRHTSKLWIKIR